MLAEMKRELAFHDDVDFIFRDAEADSKKQGEQIDELVTLPVDLLIISPNEIQPLSPRIEKIYDSGIPVVLIDRGINSKKYTAFVGASNYEVGENAGRYAVSILKGKGNVIEVMGLSDASPFIDRHRGFMDIISQQPGIKYLKKLDDHAVDYPKSLTGVFQTEKNIDLIFAQSDYIARDLYKIAKETINEKKIKIIGVDGLPSDSLGMGMVANKFLAATVLYPTGGQESIITAMKILEHKPFNKENLLATSIIDSTNVRTMQLQNDKLVEQQINIDRSQEQIEKQHVITKNQSIVIYAISISLALALIFGAILFYFFRENKIITKKLALQNEEILSQQNQLIALAKQTKEATDAKINFFTNISHEFRTPLTLILAPLEELQASIKNQHNQTRNLGLIHKNVIRLLRLVNQLMDFRKIEVDKMRLKASENDLIFFITEIIQSYQSIAAHRKIDLRLITNERRLDVWFDVNMIDKVIFNLLSNAFKFTKDNGNIHVYVNKNESGNEVIIKVEDDGIGMSEETVKNAFELFHQGEYENQRGSGLGLALSNELIKLHKGAISVTSEKWKGTIFEISLPLGNAHLEKIDITETPTVPFNFYEDEKVYTIDLKNGQGNGTEMHGLPKQKEYSVLIIEDNKDLREFLMNRLQNDYEILEADNSQSALQQAFYTVPDLIISDIVIPGKDGIALVHIFKTDIRTSHIPIILLSGQTNIEHQIEGMKNMADMYITKPFNVQFLEQTIKSLISNRSKLKDHFTSELPSNLKSQTVGKLDRKFISEFTAIIESNLANEHFAAEDISKTMGISRVQLYRKVKALLNINVNDYILSIRLQKAKYLLQHEETTISEIAYAVGFSSPAYFSTVFKSKFGVTPKAFKET
jgi:signal transduction histidine kinase/AraC-like DNA-binding protein